MQIRCTDERRPLIFPPAKHERGHDDFLEVMSTMKVEEDPQVDSGNGKKVK